MALTTAQLQTQLDELEKALHSGALSVQYEDRRVTYRSTQEMRSVASELRRRLGLAPTETYRRYGEFSKGL